MNAFPKSFRPLSALLGGLLFSTALLFAANNPPGGDPECDDPCSCNLEDDENTDPDGGSPVAIESIKFALSFGKTPFPVLNGGAIKIKKAKPTLDLYDPSVLFYTGVQGKWIWQDASNSGKRSFSLLDRNGQFIIYTFASGASVGYPTEKNSIKPTRAYLLDVDGAVVPNSAGNNAAYLELRFSSTAKQRYSLSTKQIVGVGGADGQFINMADIPAAARVDVVRIDTTLRQIKSAEGLADITPLGNENGFVIKLYPPAQVGAKTNGLYPVSGNPRRTFTFENPDAGAPNPLRMKITDVRATRTEEYMFTYQETLDDWVLNKGNGASKESKELISQPGANPKVYRRILRDGNNNVVSTVETTLLTGGWGGSVLLSRVVDPNGLNYTTTYTYNLTSGAAGYGRLASQLNPDGSWSRYTYDAQNRTVKSITPWLDSPQGAAESAARVTEYQYVSHDSTDAVADNDTRPRTIIERITGIETSRTYYVYGANSNGERVEIVERAANQNAVYGASENLRVTTTYYADTTDNANAGKVKTIQSPDNTLTTYTYGISGTGDSFAFTTTETQGTVSSPAGVANKSLQKITTADARGFIVQEQTRVYTGSDYAVLNTVQHTYDADGFKTQSTKDGRVVYDAVHEGGLLVSSTDETGIIKTYTYDALDRIATETKLGSGSQPDILTTYTRTLGGLDCGCDATLQVTVSAGGLSLTNSVKKDQIGRITEQTDNAGLVTSYAYTNGGRTTTILKPNTAMEIRETYLDGQTKNITGSGVIAQYLTYGVNSDGTQWNQVNQVSTNGPRWVKETNDFLGRAKKSERPGFGEGTIIADTSAYNTLGQLISQTTTTTGNTSLSSATGMKTITYTYDVLGDQTTTTTAYVGQTTSPVTNITQQAYATENGVWFATTKNLIQYTDENNQQQTVITSFIKQQLTGFVSGTIAYSESYAPPFANGVSVNKTTQTATLNRAVKTLIFTSTLSTSVQAAIQTTTNGLLVSSVSPDHGGATLYQYDSLGRQTGIKQPRHTNYSTITYNTFGQVSATADADGNSTTYTYYTNGTIGAGQLRQETNALGNIIFHQYDFLGRETYTWGSATYPVAQGYDAYGARNLLRTYRDTTADFSGNTFPTSATADTTTWTYDPATGVLLQKLYADNKGPTYTYYADGLLKTRTWARKDANNNPLVTTYTYTAQGQPASIDYSDTTPDVTYTYNILGQPTTVTDGSGTRTYAYDSTTLSLVQEVFSGTVNGTLNRSYDVYNRPTGYVLLDSGTTATTNPTALTAATYTYDPAGNFSQVLGDTVPAALSSGVTVSTLIPTTFTYARVPNSTLISTVTGPAHTVTNTYGSNRDHITSKQNKITDGTNANTIVSQYDYTINAIGQRTARVKNGSVFTTSNTDTFTYNSRSEVIVSTNNQISGSNRTYAYDPIGNRLSSTEGQATAPTKSQTYASNQLNQYTAIQTTTPTPPTTVTPIYDNDGNMLADGTGKTYTWDCESRLIQVTLPNNEIVKYYYDAGNCRIKREYISTTQTKVTTYLCDTWNVIREKNQTITSGATSIASKTYIWGLDISGTLQGAGGVGGLLTTNDNTLSQTYSHTYDANGNTSELVNVNGIAQAHYEYDVFSKEIVTTGNYAQNNAYRFSTKPYDFISELSYYGHRYYQSQNGRWIGRDLIYENGGINLYVFVDNDGSNLYDYLGALSLGACSRFVNNLERMRIVYPALNRVLKTAYARKCPFSIQCACCTNNFPCPSTAGGCADSNGKIYVCANNISGSYLPFVITHELIHAIQTCGKRVIDSCDKSICAEIQAYLHSGQCARRGGSRERGETTRNCVISGTMYSSKFFCPNMSKAELKKRIEELYGTCSQGLTFVK